jgi:hypothetical protein
MSIKDIKFAEDLPDSCPNGDASQVRRPGFWRFVMCKYPAGVSSIDDKAFSSQHGRDKPCAPNTDPCDWASCSLFDKARAKQMAKISPFKNKPAVCLDIASDAGPSRLDKDGHLHLWRFGTYDIMQDITETVDKL